MVKFMQTVVESLDANGEKTVIELAAREGETVSLDYIIFSATGTCKMQIWHQNTLIAEVDTRKLPPDELGMKPEIKANPGEKISIKIIDLSGAANTVSIYYEYRRETA